MPGAAGWYVNVLVGQSRQSLKPPVGGSPENELRGHSKQGTNP